MSNVDIFPEAARNERIELKMADAVNDSKEYTERIVGYVPYNISFVKAEYQGMTRMPAKITPLAKGVVGILSVDETASFDKIGKVLGLSAEDRAERSILQTAIDSLTKLNWIEGDESCFVLKDAGLEFAQKGERHEVYPCKFDIMVDSQHPKWLNIKNCIGSDNLKYIDETNSSCDNLNLALDTICQYAEHQARHAHFPQDRYFLESADWTDGHRASYKVYVWFVQQVATKEVRAFVYDEHSESLNDLIAEYINSDAALLNELLSNCINCAFEGHDEVEELNGTSIEAEITDEQKAAETQLISEQEDAAAKDLNEDAIDDEKKSILKSGDKRLHKRALYDSLSFEVELRKIFTEDNPDEIWLISPWIRGAFAYDRGPMIEEFLKNKDKKVFIAYSEPAKSSVEPMVDKNMEACIAQLENQYSNFFYVQLPEFHLKNVIEVRGEQKILFSGSFNVLSFSVSEQQTHIRKEEMMLAHYSVARKKHSEYQYSFAEAYAKRITEQVEALDDSLVSDYNKDRLKYFRSIHDPQIEKLFSPVDELIEEKMLANTKQVLLDELNDVKRQLEAASNNGGLDANKKKQLEVRLASIDKEMTSNNVDDPTMLNLLEKNKESLGNVPEKKIFPGRKKTVSSPASSSSNSVKAIREVSTKITTLEELAFHIAQLKLRFTQREIRKGELNQELSKIVREDRFVDWLEMIKVADSRNNANAFDLSLGVNGYLFRFAALFNDKGVFVSKQKRASRLLMQVNDKNIEAVINTLSKNV